MKSILLRDLEDFRHDPNHYRQSFGIEKKKTEEEKDESHSQWQKKHWLNAEGATPVLLRTDEANNRI